ncbi:unnamed protein product [Didymodactylos carnosus]|uniref:Uncharacterized protein n=1 Tax=Didymodactylos carnosus TaxID=1234261 RepID=A0A815TQ76_9BILA|nr:unnamed protein product [Didymodactylos carnosus]CAF4369135.1 unnamed protein product [Didymodactylos carnosus]
MPAWKLAAVTMDIERLKSENNHLELDNNCTKQKLEITKSLLYASKPLEGTYAQLMSLVENNSADSEFIEQIEYFCHVFKIQFELVSPKDLEFILGLQLLLARIMIDQKNYVLLL